MKFNLKARHAPSALRVLCLAVISAICGTAAAQAALEPVIITGTRFADDAQALPFGVSVITAQDIQRSGANTVNEAIMKLLGVPGRLDLNGGGDYALDLRGFGSTSDSNQVIVIDGIRVSEGDIGGTRIAGIPIDTVERIEVLRGSGTVLYGEGAAGGVIIITTKAGKGVSRADSAQIYAGAGSFGTRELRTSATLTAGDFSLDVAANRRLSDNHRDNFKAAVKGASVAGQWSDDTLRVVARHAYDHLESGLPGALSAAQYNADPSQASSLIDHGAIRNQRSSILGEAKLGDWELGVDAGWRSKSLASINGGFPFDYDVEATHQAVRARHTGLLAGLRNSVVFGADADNWRRTVLGSFGSVAEQSNRALYAKDDLTLAGGTRLSAGLRREAVKKEVIGNPDRVDRSLNGWELGAVQPVTPAVQVYGRIGKSFRLANVDEFTFTSPGLTLRPQTSRDTELGARWRHAAGRFELRAHRSTLTDEIGFDPNAPGPFGAGANVNFDPTRRQGIEAEASHKLTSALELRATAAVRQSRFTAGTYDGKDVPLVPRRTASLGAQWQVLAAHQLGATVYYASQSRPDFDNVCRMPAVSTLDLRYAYVLPVVELSLTVANATDRQYYTQAFRCVAGETTAIYPEAGRAVMAAARFRF
jgi:iron complex outermembrane receptor protein